LHEPSFPQKINRLGLRVHHEQIATTGWRLFEDADPDLFLTLTRQKLKIHHGTMEKLVRDETKPNQSFQTGV
jgi:hypothetical protein